MKTGRNAAALLRAGGVICMVAILVAGVTFAALRSQNNLVNGSRLTSASANLLMSKEANSVFNSSMTGFDFFDLEPGGPAAPAAGHDLFFKNVGSTNLDMKLSLNPAFLANWSGADLQHIHFAVYDWDGENLFAKYSLAQLRDAYTAGAPLPLNVVIGKDVTLNFKIRMQLDGQGISTTDQISLDNLDYVFSGVAV
jgi:hypothetical protein